MIQKVFRSSRFLVLIAVAICSLAAVMLYAAGISIIAQLLLELVETGLPATADGGKGLVVDLLKTFDTLLIAVTFQIIAASLYKIFIAPDTIADSMMLRTLHIDDFHDLKVILIQIAVVIMVILFLEQAVEVGATLETLYFGVAIALVILASVFAWKHADKT